MTVSGRERLVQQFHGLRGQEFIDALVDELAALNSRLGEAEAVMKQLDVFATYADRMAVMNAAAAAGSAPLMTTCELTPDQFFTPGINIYGLEYSGDGTPYRWTGPEPDTTFLLQLDRTVPLCLKLDFVPGDAQEEKLPLTLLVDGRPVQYTLMEGSRVLLVATLPPREEAGGAVTGAATSVTVIVRQTLQPSNEDDRKLGIGFFGLSVTPADKSRSGSDTAANAG